MRINALHFDDPRWPKWGQRWQQPINFARLDMIELPKSSMEGIAQLLASRCSLNMLENPALPEFTLKITDEEESEETVICFKKTVLPTEDMRADYPDGSTGTAKSRIDAYIFLDGTKEVDWVVNLGWHINGSNEGAFYCWPVLAKNGYTDLEPTVVGEVAVAYALIQEVLYNRPTVFREASSRRIGVGNNLSNKKRKKSRTNQRNKVKVVRAMLLQPDEFEDFCEETREENRPKRVYENPCWGVVAHPRKYRDKVTGEIIKEIRIGPYNKGRDRNNPDAYVGKDYQLVPHEHEEET